MVENIEITDEEFGPILKYIRDDTYVNINYTNNTLYLRDKENNLYKINDSEAINSWAKKFFNMICEKTNRHIDFYDPYIYVWANNDNLKITCTSVPMTNLDCVITIRKFN